MDSYKSIRDWKSMLFKFQPRSENLNTNRVKYRKSPSGRFLIIIRRRVTISDP